MFNEIGGTPNADDRIGTKGRDKITTGGGADRLDGLAGADRLFGQGGNDTFVISKGRDSIYGGAGIDTIDASGFKFGVYVNLFTYGYTDYSSSSPTSGLEVAGETLKLGAKGPNENWTVQKVFSIELFVGSDHNDLFRAPTISGVIKMGKGDDTVTALDGVAKLFGGAGDDDLNLGDGGKAIGGAGNDTLTGGHTSSSILLGGKGDDLLIVTATDVARGGAGNDRLYVSESNTNTKLFGGAGADTFDFGYFQSGFIEDFQPGKDKVDISGHVDKADATWAELSTMFDHGERGVRLTFDFDSLSGQYVEFVGLTMSDLSADDFILV